MRSLAFALFQIVVTPLYALAAMALFWVPAVPRYRFITGWCALNLWAARWICGIRARVEGLENVGAQPPVPMPMLARAEAAQDAAVPVQPGEQSFSVDVQVTFALR